MADNSLITNAEKASLNRARIEIAKINKEMDGLMRQSNANATWIIARRAQATADQDLSFMMVR
jgi:hypothetical protein